MFVIYGKHEKKINSISHERQQDPYSVMWPVIWRNKCVRASMLIKAKRKNMLRYRDLQGFVES